MWLTDASATQVRKSPHKRYRNQIDSRKRSSRPSPNRRKRSQSIEKDGGVKRRRWHGSSTPERRRLRSSSAHSLDGSGRRDPSHERRSHSRKRSQDRHETEFELRKQQCLAILHSGKMLSKEEFEMVKSFMHRESSDSFSQEQFESLKRSLNIESGHRSGHPSSSHESLNSVDRRMRDEPYVPEPAAVGMMIVGAALAKMDKFVFGPRFTAMSFAGKMLVWPGLCYLFVMLDQYVLGWYAQDIHHLIMMTKLRHHPNHHQCLHRHSS